MSGFDFITHSWLIVALPVAAFLNIALVIMIAGKSQALAQRVAPWILIVALLGALGVAMGGLLHTAGGAGYGHGAGLTNPSAALTVEWLTPQPPSAMTGTLPNLPLWLDRTLKVGTLIDPLSAVMLVVVLLVSLLVQIYSLSYIKREEHPRFYLYMSLFTASMLGLVIAPTLLQLFIFWELVGVSSYFLIGFWYHKPEAARAAIKAFVVTRFGDLGLLFALIFLWIGYGDLSFAHLSQAITPGAVAPAALPVSLTAVAILLFIGACGKSAQFPLHIWLPDAMEGPTSVSALIHAATMVAAGVYLVARTFFLFEAAPDALIVVAFIGGFTALFAASIGLVQDDMKKVMAYSTISQLGYMMMGLGLASPTAAFFHLTTHAFFKALLFLTAGAVIHAVHSQNMWEMGGLWSKMRTTALTCLLGGLALAGIFPLAGFFSKDKLLEAALAVALGHGTTGAAIAPGLAWAILGMALLTVVMTAFYTTRMWVLVFGGTARSKGAEHAHEAPASMRIPLLVLATLTVVAGLAIVKVPALAALMGLAGHHDEGLSAGQILGMTALASALAGGGIFLGWRVYATATTEPLRAWGPLYRTLVRLWYVDAFFTWLAGHVVLVLGRMIAWFDKRVIDGGLVDGTAWSLGRVGQGIRRLSAGPVPGHLQYAALVIFIVTAVIVLAMTMQDGVDAVTWGVVSR
jgi:NADH-quinone oxidoreductase subunit L